MYGRRPVICPARILGGYKNPDGESGYFGVRLDLLLR
jgi:hypothetical protein